VGYQAGPVFGGPQGPVGCAEAVSPQLQRASDAAQWLDAPVRIHIARPLSRPPEPKGFGRGETADGPRVPIMPRIVIDPLTRIEGHLRIEAEVKDGSLNDAWVSGTMFRGLELILKDRDPRDAWYFVQRICNVCTIVHALASVRAVENALGIPIPENANLIRNLMAAMQCIHNHVMHFYHLHALD